MFYKPPKPKFKRSPPPQMLCVGLICLFTLLSSSAPATAQLRIGNFKSEKPTVFVAAPREVTRPLKIAEKAIEAGDFDQATRLLGELLADSILNEYLIADEKQWGRAISLRQKAEQLLGEIPFEKRTSYEERYGVRASVALETAIAENDLQSIALTSRLYFHTRAGLDATMLMGHSHLADGRPVMAAVAFEKVAAEAEGRKRFDPEATLLAAVAWSLNGSTDRGEKLLLNLKKRQGDAEVRFYGKKVPLFDDSTSEKIGSVGRGKNRWFFGKKMPSSDDDTPPKVASTDGENGKLLGAKNPDPATEARFSGSTPLQVWLKEIVASTPLKTNPVVNQWLVYRGDAQRNAGSGGGFPLLSPRWSIRTVTDPTDEAGIQEFQQKLIRAKVSPMPKVNPLAIGNTIVIRTDDRMYGVDANNGKRIWSYPPADVFRSREQKSGDATSRPSAKLHQDKLRERLWLDSLYGQISSDGDSVFLIPNPGISTDRDDWRSYQTQIYDEPTDLRLYNDLKSLDLKQQGALQWQVGGESGLDEPLLAKAFFLGAPLPMGKKLYVICLQEQSVRLVVLSSETGRLLWARDLASTDESVWFREERLRRLAGATPSEANGVLICPTGLNAIVAVDLATQSLSWGFQFKDPSRARVDRLTDQLTKWDTMWRDASVTLTGGTVVYTPIDSDEVYCLNLQTGDSLWDDRRKRRSRTKYKAMHVETVRNRQIIITSTDRLKGVALDTGEVTWEFRLGDLGLVSGRGYVSGDHCYIPTTTKKVLRINTASGDLEGFAMTDKVLGNLISYRGDVISHGADHLTAYPRDEPSRLSLAESTPQQSEDHSLLSIKAQLHLLDGEYAQSVDAISKAYDLFPNSNYARVLVQALKQLIDVDFAKAERISDRYQNLFGTEDLHRLLRGKVAGLIKLDRIEDAYKTLMQIADTIELTPAPASLAGKRIEDETSVVLQAASADLAESLVKDSANAELTMQLKQWLRWKLKELFERSNDQQKAKLKESIANHLKQFNNFEGGKSDSLLLWHDRLRLFPQDAVDEKIKLETASQLFAGGHYVRAVSLIGTTEALDDSENSEKRPNGAIAHARRLLEKMKSVDVEAKQISELEEVIANLESFRTSDRDFLKPDFYETSSNHSKSSGRLLRMDELDVQWGRDIQQIQQQTNRNYFIGTQHFCETVVTDQPELDSLSFRYSDEFREFQMFDRLGRLVNKIYLDPDGNFQGTKQGTKGRILLYRSLMLLCIDQEMFAINWEKFVRGQPALLWYADKVVCSSSGIASETMEGVCVLKDGLLMCLSPFTGEVLWQRTHVSPRSKLLEGEQSLTIWSRSGRTHDTVDRSTGRFLACGEMPGLYGNASLSSSDLQLFVEPKRPEAKKEDENEDGVEAVFNTPRKVYDALDLNLFDFNQQEFLWSKTLPYPSHTKLVDQQHLLILSNDGVFSMIDFRSGETKFETKVPELENGATSGLIVNKFNGTYVVTVYSVKQQSEFVNQDDVRVTFQRMHKGNAMINGNIVALDAETGAAVWKRPVVVQRFQMLEGLPWDCPFLFLARRNTYESDTTQVRLQFAMIDIKSGKLKRNELFKVPVRDEVFYQVVCQPKFSDSQEQVIQLEVASLEAKLFLNNLPAPPQPVAALTNQGSFKRMKRETSSAPASLSLATDLGALIEEAIADEAQRVELGKEEVRLTEIEMQSK